MVQTNEGIEDPVCSNILSACSVRWAVWFASQLESRVSTLETKSLKIAEENRKFLVNEVIPAFKRDNWLGQQWKNTHF